MDPLIQIFNGRVRALGEAGQKRIFAQVTVELRKYMKNFGPHAFYIFINIALHTDADGWTDVEVATIAKECGVHPTTVSKALTKLSDIKVKGHRVLLVIQERSQGGSFARNRYLIFPSREDLERYKEMERRPRTSQPPGFKAITPAGAPDSPDTENPLPDTPNSNTPNQLTQVEPSTQLPYSVGPNTDGPSTAPAPHIGITIGEGEPGEEEVSGQTGSAGGASLTPSDLEVRKPRPRARAKKPPPERDPLLDHQAVKIFNRVVKRWPNHIQRKQIAERLDESLYRYSMPGAAKPPNEPLALWERVLTQWLARGYNPVNIHGQLDVYNRVQAGELLEEALNGKPRAKNHSPAGREPGDSSDDREFTPADTIE